MERAERMALFEERVARLSKAVKHNLPAPLVCLALKSCLLSAILIYGESGAAIVTELLLTQTREANGLCPFDGRPADEEKAGMCNECWKQAEDDDALADAGEPPTPSGAAGGKA